MAQIPLRNKNRTHFRSYIMVLVCTDEFRKLKSEYLACEAVEDKEEKKKRVKEVRSKINALLARVRKLGKPGNELRKAIESCLKGEDEPKSLLEKAILEREGGSIISVHPARNPKNKTRGVNLLLENIDIREIQTIPVSQPKIKPPSPRDEILESLKISKINLPQIKDRGKP